ncbi:hypothetical protein N4239_08740 [Brachyspira hyodysenteriae]|uniref:hypothetical protein n=1 Tax=Brachyspira hyodysenteriae TaxID=159 RepID=UPI002B25EF13|nr:hypothetical protein [Brachyspira hyodysenteriae]WPC23027.1 hypothetical protein N4239_08740 [Brachyspira hyodysenteriae]
MTPFSTVFLLLSVPVISSINSSSVLISLSMISLLFFLIVILQDLFIFIIY